MTDDFVHRLLLYIGSFGSAEIVMALWPITPTWEHGLVLLLGAFIADGIWRFVIKAH